MAKIEVKNIKNEKVKDLTLNASVFGVEPNEVVLTKAVKLQQAASRQGTAKTKTVAEVSGGGKKPWRQKGTGRARQGSIRAAQWRGGGIVFGVSPRDYTFKMNKKERALALKSALTLVAKEKKLVVVDSLELASSKSSAVKELMKSLKLAGKVLFVTASDNENLYLAGRNMGNVYSIIAAEVNCYDLLNANYVVVEEEAMKKIEEALK